MLKTLKSLFFLVLTVCVITLCFFTVPLKAEVLKPQMRDTLTKAIVTIETTTSRASYGNLGNTGGAGFIWDKTKGWIITTHDVVGYGGVVATYRVTFSGGQKLQATLVYADPSKNFAILAINPKEILVPVEQLNTFAPKTSLGEEVVVLGREGEQDICQSGQVVAKYESVSRLLPQQALRISLNAVGACTGAPVLNSKGEMTGLVVEKSNTFVSALWGAFIKDGLDDLTKKKVPLRRAFKAVILTKSLEDCKKYFLFPAPVLADYMTKHPDALGHGLVVVSVPDNEPSSFQVGDVLWAVDGQELGPDRHKMETVLNTTSSDSLNVTVFRKGRRVTFKASLETLDPFPIKEMLFWGGGMFYEADSIVEQICEIPKGRVVISHVLPGSPFSSVFGSLMPENGGLRIMIDQINGHEIKTLADLKGVLPSLTTKEHFSVVFRDFGITSMTGDSGLRINRQAKITGIDFLVKLMPTERLIFDSNTCTWDSSPLDQTACVSKMPDPSFKVSTPLTAPLS